MDRTITLAKKAETSLNDIVGHAVKLERENAHLKRVIRTIAGGTTTGEDGQPVTAYSQEEFEYIQNVCEEFHVFTDNQGEV